MRSIPRLLISGVAGGSGKTLVSLGLCRALSRQNTRIKAYKKGPDYIDAAWLGLATGRPATNLDPFFLSDKQLLSLLEQSFTEADLAIIEGNRGLYDGRDIQGSCSTAALARIVDAPVLLTLNITKMTRTAAAIVAGLAAFEPIRLAGVILNQAGSARHASVVRQAIEAHTDIPVLGILPRLAVNPLQERHMGLTSIHDEHGGNNDVSPLQQIDSIADMLVEHVNLDAIRQLAMSASLLPAALPFWTDTPVVTSRRPRLGYVRDAVLWFYYEENLEALRRAGADLVALSLLDDAPWPALDGLYLGGGFPEMVAQRLSVSPHLQTIRRLSEQGVPIYAECGGLMILCDTLRYEGHDFPMAGVFPARIDCCPKPQGLGYVEAHVVRDNPFHPEGTCWRGHEFHYSRCVPLQSVETVLHLEGGSGLPGSGAKGASSASWKRGTDGLLSRNTFGSYTHLFAPSVPHWAERFVRLCDASMDARR